MHFKSNIPCSVQFFAQAYGRKPAVAKRGSVLSPIKLCLGKEIQCIDDNMKIVRWLVVNNLLKFCNSQTVCKKAL